MILGMNGSAGDGGHRDDQGRPGRGREIDAALRDLNQCVDRVHALIPRVNAMIERRQVRGPRGAMNSCVIYGGGPSAFARKRSSSSQGARPPDRPTARQDSVGQSRMASSGQLLVAADLALAGYSRDQIGAHLRARRGPAAASAVDDAFE